MKKAFINTIACVLLFVTGACAQLPLITSTPTPNPSVTPTFIPTSTATLKPTSTATLKPTSTPTIKPSPTYTLTPSVISLANANKLIQLFKIGKNNIADKGWLFRIRSVWNPQENILAVNNYQSGAITLWNLDTDQPEPVDIEGKGIIDFTPDGRFLITIIEGDDILISPGGSEIPNVLFQVWDIETGELMHTLEFKKMISPISPATSPDGKYFATGGDSTPEDLNTVKVWDIQSGQLLFDFHQINFEQLAFSPDGKILATCGARQIKIWDLTTGEMIKLLYQMGDVRSITFSPDGRLLASSSTFWIIDYQMSIIIWNLETFQPSIKINEASPRVLFSPDGRILGSIGKSGEYNYFDKVDLWNVDTGAHLYEFFPGWEWPKTTFMEISPDGSLILTGVSRKNAQLWDVKTGRLLKSFVLSLTQEQGFFSPDKSKLAFPCDDGFVRVYGVKP